MCCEKIGQDHLRFVAGAAMQRLKIAADLMRIGAGTAAAGRAEASGKADPPGMPDGTLKRSRAASATVSFLCLYHGYYRLHMIGPGEQIERLCAFKRVSRAAQLGNIARKCCRVA